jgi:vacuole morphology and inheritance protein 14
MDQEDSSTSNRVNIVRRSRAERARLEIERRHRSLSRGSDASNTSSSTSSKTNKSSLAGNSSNAASKVAATSNTTAASTQSSARSSIQNSHGIPSNVGGGDAPVAAIGSTPSPMRSRLEKYEKKGIRVSKKDLSPTSRIRQQHQQQQQKTQKQQEHHGYYNTGANDSAGSQVKMQPKSAGQQQQQQQQTLAVDRKQSQEQVQSYSREEHQQYLMQRQIQQEQEAKQQAMIKAAPSRGQVEPQPVSAQQHQQQSRPVQNQNYQLVEPQNNLKSTNPVKKPVLVATKSAGSANSSGAISSTGTSKVQPNAAFGMTQNDAKGSPLPQVVYRALGDRSYEKRKNAALEIEALVKSLAEIAATSNPSTSQEHKMIELLIQSLARDFCPAMNAHFRKGGLIGLAATAIGLMPQEGLKDIYLASLIKPVLNCFDDPEPRVRYYACESLYNIVKVARGSILAYFNKIFEGVATVLADTDEEVRDGANLLDRLVKDIVTESDEFSVDKFLPLLQNYIRRTNPYIRQLVVGWITVLDGIPDVCLIDYLPDFLDGLFNMLSDSNLEIRQAADSALSEFLREIRNSEVLEFGPIVNILVFQCQSKERLIRLTSVTWLAELIHHPDSGGDKLLPFHAGVLSAILNCISDTEVEIRKVSERSNGDLLALIRDTKHYFELRILVETLTKKLADKDDVPTKMATLKWVNMLLEKRRRDMDSFINDLMPALLQLLSDQSDGVVLLTVQVLSRISLSEIDWKGTSSREKVRDEEQFEMVIKSILKLFRDDRRLLETRGSLIVRRLCVLLNAKSVYLVMADIISSYDLSPESGESFTLEFVATMVQTLNLILLTASELYNLRQLLEESFAGEIPDEGSATSRSRTEKYNAKNEGARVFASLFHCWSNNPVSTFSLCLLARAYDLAFDIVKKFSRLEITVGFLMQIDKLVHLIESPIFVHIRLQLLDAEAPYHTYLLKSCYGLLMLLPQSDAYHSLNDRLTSVCNLRDNLGIRPSIIASPSTGAIRNDDSSIYHAGLDSSDLLERFDEVMTMHKEARAAIQQATMMHQQDITKDRNFLTSGIRNAPQRNDQLPKSMGGAGPMRQHG